MKIANHDSKENGSLGLCTARRAPQPVKSKGTFMKSLGSRASREWPSESPDSAPAQSYEVSREATDRFSVVHISCILCHWRRWWDKQSCTSRTRSVEHCWDQIRPQGIQTDTYPSWICTRQVSKPHSFVRIGSHVRLPGTVRAAHVAAFGTFLVASYEQGFAFMACSSYTLARLLVDQVLAPFPTRSLENKFLLFLIIIRNDRCVFLVGLDDGSASQAAGSELCLGALGRVA